MKPNSIKGAQQITLIPILMENSSAFHKTKKMFSFLGEVCKKFIKYALRNERVQSTITTLSMPSTAKRVKFRRYLPRHYTQSYSTIPSTSNQLSAESPRILVTGGLGQLGPSLVKLLRTQYGKNNVITTDIERPSDRVTTEGPYAYLDVLDKPELQKMVVNERIDWLIHFASLLSVFGDYNIQRSMEVNLEGAQNVFDVSNQHKLRVFIPSSITAFGPESPRDPTPNVTVQRPRTISGVSKVHVELLGEYFHYRYGLDFRCLRLPLIISDVKSSGAVSEFTKMMFKGALRNGRYTCFLREDTRLPMMYLEDCSHAIAQFMQLSPDKLKRRTYNVTGASWTPQELADKIKEHIPNFVVRYELDERQNIADAWPQSLDDSEAKKDWQWSPKYDLNKTVEIMMEVLKEQVAAEDDTVVSTTG